MIDPNQALQALLQRDGLNVYHFPPTSRYYGLATATLTDADGDVHIYVRRRFLPQPEGFSLLQEHEVKQGDRLDNLASAYLGDAEQYWRICDANIAMRPDELTETMGRRLRITLPEGIPGTPNA
jgi:hypothetical protein